MVHHVAYLLQLTILQISKAIFKSITSRHIEMIEHETENKKKENASKQAPSQSSTGDATPF
jgi:hypothetical protein